jgi:predicted RNA methylase
MPLSYVAPTGPAAYESGVNRSRARAERDQGSYEMWAIAGRPSLPRLAAALRERREPPDRLFDHYLPRALRQVSARHWTPLAVVARAAAWLDDLGIRSLVDVGSGAGKFCVAAALACDTSFVGIEQRGDLVQAARELARLFGVEGRVRFEQAAFTPCALPPADAYYVYNPFGENLLRSDEQIDLEVELSAERHAREVTAFEAMLRALPSGAHLLAYNGFGGAMPATFSELRSDDSLPNALRLWRKDA